MLVIMQAISLSNSIAININMSLVNLIGFHKAEYAVQAKPKVFINIVMLYTQQRMGVNKGCKEERYI